MPTAKRLPSGAWRVQIYSHTDANGKIIRESFTAPTKREAEFQAAEWKNKKDRHVRSDLIVQDAIKGYIDAKRAVLSPSTIRGYERMLRNNYVSIGKKSIRKLTTEDLQLFISALTQKLSPKSVANIYGLLSSALSFYMPESVFRVSLPQKSKKKAVSPTDDDIKVLYSSATKELKKCILLAAFGSLRRGEIVALTYADLSDDGVLTVNKDMVQDTNSIWVLKDKPKTDASEREIVLPDKVIKELGSGRPEERIIKYKNPGSITQCFTKLRDRIGVNIRFHDLRHYFASIGAVLGIPDTYLADFGGWERGSKVMKSVYQNKITPMSKIYNQKMNKHFNDII